MEVRYFSAGVDASVQPGDFILTHSAGLVGWAIRFGQRLRYRKARRPYAWFNHAAGVVAADGTLVEMLARGATVSGLSKYSNRDYTVVSPDLDTDRRAETVAYWQWLAATHTGYGWASIAADALSLATGIHLAAATDMRPVCSAAVAAGIGENPWRACAAAVMPADLAAFYQALPPTSAKGPFHMPFIQSARARWAKLSAEAQKTITWAAGVATAIGSVLTVLDTSGLISGLHLPAAAVAVLTAAPAAISGAVAWMKAHKLAKAAAK